MRIAIIIMALTLTTFAFARKNKDCIGKCNSRSPAVVAMNLEGVRNIASVAEKSEIAGLANVCDAAEIANYSDFVEAVKKTGRKLHEIHKKLDCIPMINFARAVDKTAEINFILDYMINQKATKREIKTVLEKENDTGDTILSILEEDDSNDKIKKLIKRIKRYRPSSQ